jgi:hypothetical protein
MVALRPQWQIVRTSRISSASASSVAEPGNSSPGSPRAGRRPSPGLEVVHRAGELPDLGGGGTAPRPRRRRRRGPGQPVPRSREEVVAGVVGVGRALDARCGSGCAPRPRGCRAARSAGRSPSRVRCSCRTPGGGSCSSRVHGRVVEVQLGHGGGVAAPRPKGRAPTPMPRPVRHGTPRPPDGRPVGSGWRWPRGPGGHRDSPGWGLIRALLGRGSQERVKGRLRARRERRRGQGRAPSRRGGALSWARCRACRAPRA